MTDARERLRALLQKSALESQSAPLTYAQQRLWFAEQLEPGTPLYNVPFVIGMRGALDVGALERSLQDIVHRHEPLRTTFQSHDGQPVQAIAPPAPRALDVVELSDAGAWQALKSAEAARPFDLATGPLLRTLLVRHADRSHSLLLTLHHIVADGWSIGVLVHELAVLYEAHARGEVPALPPLPLRYVDHARRERAWILSEDAARQLAYWTRQLSGAPAELGLPTDRPRGPIRSGLGDELPVAIPAPLTARLAALAHRHGATLFMMLLAAYQVLLARIAGQTEVVIGSVAANRNASELESLIGIFVNFLALRGELAGNPRFVDHLAAVKATALAAYGHRDLPFDHLVEALAVERDLARTPVFQAMLVLQNAPLAPLTLPGLVITPEEVPRRTAQTDLSLTLRELDGQLVGALEYDTDLFDRETVARWMEHFETLLEGVVADPDRRVLEIPLLTTAQRDHLVYTLSGRAAAVTEPPECLHRSFEAQARRTPTAIAVAGCGSPRSYDTVNRSANRLARRLQSHGVTREGLVAIGLPRCADEIVARLAVLKAGGAFIPIDPALPALRRRQLLAQSGARLVVARDGDPAFLDGTAAACTCVCVDDPSLGAERDDDLPDIATLDSLAYVIYTSGSTGLPKGVMVPHRGIAHRMLWEQRELPLSADDRLLQLASPGFDASIWEMFRAFLAGARAVVIPPDRSGDTRYLVDCMVDEAITVIGVVPSLLDALLDEPRFAACTHLAHVVCAGEPLYRDVQDRFAATHRGQLYNFYGQTEVSIDATWWTGPPGRALAPLGRPISGMEVYVLDDARSPQPLGVPGEVYIAGPALARGYLGDEALTREVFVPHPFRDGARAFRTGDRARFRTDGLLEFVGRDGDQVKIRGNRIELGEIEAVLKQHPAVRHVALLVSRPDDAAGDGDRLLRLVEAVERSPQTTKHGEVVSYGD